MAPPIPFRLVGREFDSRKRGRDWFNAENFAAAFGGFGDG
jgi:hypothetical protein